MGKFDVSRDFGWYIWKDIIIKKYYSWEGLKADSLRDMKLKIKEKIA